MMAFTINHPVASRQEAIMRELRVIAMGENPEASRDYVRWLTAQLFKARTIEGKVIMKNE